MDDVDYEKTLNDGNSIEVYLTLKSKMISLCQKLVTKHKDDLSILFPVINKIEDQLLDGSLINAQLQIPPVPPPQPSSSSSKTKGDVYLVDYNDNCCAVFGHTKVIKDALAKATGRFNQNLTDPTTGQKQPGWIFKKALKETVNELLKTLIVSYNGPTSVAVAVENDPAPIDGSEVSVTTASELTVPSNMNTINNEANETASSVLPKIYFCNYSEKALAIFGDAFSQAEHKEFFKENGGKFNKFLSNPHTNTKQAGWIFQLKSSENLLSKGIPFLKTSTAATAATAATATSATATSATATSASTKAVDSTLGKRKIDNDDEEEDFV